jgi:hypothetical protein
VTAVESFWMDLVLRHHLVSSEDYGADFRLEADESAADVVERSRHRAAETEKIVADISDLGHAVPVPPCVPWFPPASRPGRGAGCSSICSRRRPVMPGHANIVPHAIDGGPAFPPRSAAEGWPAPAWLPP